MKIYRASALQEYLKDEEKYIIWKAINLLGDENIMIIMDISYMELGELLTKIPGALIGLDGQISTYTRGGVCIRYIP